MLPILVTGAAGFIGFHVAQRLLAEGRPVVGVDNLNAYYLPELKAARLAALQAQEGFAFERLDLADRDATRDMFARLAPTHVIHLAAQPGVRYSIENPHAYLDANLAGFLNVLEGCRHARTHHLLFASSSSVYGANRKVPFALEDSVDHPISLYAATKKANELMAHTYAHLYGLPVTGLRFFTVYGPWGRPDMAVWSFTEALFEGRPIALYNHGDMRRDFTYVDDIVEAIVRLTDQPAQPNPDWDPRAPDPASSHAPYRIYNIGNHTPVAVPELVRLLEQASGLTATVEMKPMQPGDVLETYADVSALEAAVGFRPKTTLAEGTAAFVDWYRWWRGRNA